MLCRLREKIRIQLDLEVYEKLIQRERVVISELRTRDGENEGIFPRSQSCAAVLWVGKMSKPFQQR